MMVSNRLLYFNIFRELIAMQFITVYKQLGGMIINLYIWAFCSLVIMGYIMQSFGLAANFGCFQFAGIIGTVGFFEIFSNVTKNVMDFDGDRNISYYLTLPAKPWVIFGSFVAFYSLLGIFLSIIVFPFGWLILYNSFDISQVSWFKSIAMTVMVNIFFGVFTLFITSLVHTMSQIRNVWARFMFPIWILGGFQFSWAVMYAKSAPFAYLMLINPIIFVMEGMRASLLGQTGSLPWGLCFGALILFTLLCWMVTMRKLRRLLDIV